MKYHTLQFKYNVGQTNKIAEIIFGHIVDSRATCGRRCEAGCVSARCRRQVAAASTTRAALFR